MVAGVGFEPHGLRVMSPTSYQAALPRDTLFRFSFGKLFYNITFKRICQPLFALYSIFFVPLASFY